MSDIAKPTKKVGRPKKMKVDIAEEEPLSRAAEIEAALMQRLDSLIDIKLVSTLTSLSPREIQRRVANGKFPSPKQIGQMRVAWNLSTVQGWIQSPTI